MEGVYPLLMQKLLLLWVLEESLFALVLFIITFIFWCSFARVCLFGFEERGPLFPLLFWTYLVQGCDPSCLAFMEVDLTPIKVGNLSRARFDSTRCDVYAHIFLVRKVPLCSSILMTLYFRWCDMEWPSEFLSPPMWWTWSWLVSSSRIFFVGRLDPIEVEFNLVILVVEVSYIEGEGR